MSNSIDAAAIGCEKLCGRCDACFTLDMAIRYARAAESHGFGMRAAQEARADMANASRAVTDPSAIANLLARAMRGRGARLIRCSQQMVEPYTTIVVILRESCRTLTLTMAQARTVLAHTMALPLDCGADAAVAALEAT